MKLKRKDENLLSIVEFGSNREISGLGRVDILFESSEVVFGKILLIRRHKSVFGGEFLPNSTFVINDGACFFGKTLPIDAL